MRERVQWGLLPRGDERTQPQAADNYFSFSRLAQAADRILCGAESCKIEQSRPTAPVQPGNDPLPTKLDGKNILSIAPASALETTRSLLLKRAGFELRRAKTFSEAQQLLIENAFPVVIFGANFPTSDALMLARIARERSPQTRLIATGRQAIRDEVDGFLPPQQEPDIFLRLVGSLLMQAHGHPEIAGKYVMYVDAERRYISVTDGVCKLLGYAREELLGMSIDELAYPETADVPAQFAKFRHAGRQQGYFLLRDASASAVPVRFKAAVLGDGCMVSVLTPVKTSKAAKNSARKKNRRAKTRTNPASAR